MQCNVLTLEAFGALDEPREWLVYDYAMFDPEEELYGEYEANPEMASREGYTIRNWTPGTDTLAETFDDEDLLDEIFDDEDSLDEILDDEDS